MRGNEGRTDESSTDLDEKEGDDGDEKDKKQKKKKKEKKNTIKGAKDVKKEKKRGDAGRRSNSPSGGGASKRVRYKERPMRSPNKLTNKERNAPRYNPTRNSLQSPKITCLIFAPLQYCQVDFWGLVSYSLDSSATSNSVFPRPFEKES